MVWDANDWIYDGSLRGIDLPASVHTLLILDFSSSRLQLRGLLSLQINAMLLPSSKQGKALDRPELESTHTNFILVLILLPLPCSVTFINEKIK